MVKGVQDIYYNVADVARAVTFYRDVLGMTVTDEDPHFVGLDAGGVRVGLHWNGGTAVPKTPRDAHGQACGGTLTFRVDSAATAKAKLEENGVTVLGYSENPWGNFVVFEDPDGNVLKAMSPGSG